MRGQPDLILVFINILCHCDASGICDRHWSAISDETGLDKEQVKKALIGLEAPDSESRTPTDEGRRLSRISDQRTWGWQVINFEKYRELHNSEGYREYMREYMSHKRNTSKGFNKLKHVIKSRVYVSEDVSSLKGGCKGEKPKTFKQWNSEDLSNAVKAIDDILDPGQEQAFVDYWTEPMPSGKPRLFAEKAWDTKRRMRTWARNNERNTYKQPKPTRSAGFKVSRDVAIGQAIDALDHAAESTDDDAVSRCLSVLNDKYRDVGKNREGQMVATEAYEVWKFRGKKNRR